MNDDIHDNIFKLESKTWDERRIFFCSCIISEMWNENASRGRVVGTWENSFGDCFWRWTLLFIIDNIFASIIAINGKFDLQDFQSSLTQRLRDFHFFVSFGSRKELWFVDEFFMKYFSRNFYLFIVEKIALNGAFCGQYKSKVWTIMFLVALQRS